MLDLPAARALAQRATDDESPDDALFNQMRRELRVARSKWPPKNKHIALAAWAVRHGDILLRQSESVPALAALVEQMAQRIEELEGACKREEEAHLITIRQRDAAEEAADTLAHGIAKLYDPSKDAIEVIGEHSNLNCPWAQAGRLLEEIGSNGKPSNQ